MRRRADIDEGGDPSAWRATLRVVARVLQVGGAALAIFGWVMVRGRYEIVSPTRGMVLAGAGFVAWVVGSWLAARALRTLEPERED